VAHAQALQVMRIRPMSRRHDEALALRANLTFKQSRDITNGLHCCRCNLRRASPLRDTRALRADPQVSRLTSISAASLTRSPMDPRSLVSG